MQAYLDDDWTIDPLTATQGTINPQVPAGKILVKGNINPPIPGGITNDAPIQGLKICVYKGNTTLGEGLTDVNGHFEVLIDDSNTIDIYIKIVMDDDIVCIKDITQVILDVLPLFEGNPFEYNSQCQNLQSGHNELDFGNLVSSQKGAGVLNIWRFVRLSHAFYMNNSTGPQKNLPKLKLYWNSENLTGNPGSTELPILYIGQSDAFDKFTIVHEYGHYVMQCNGVYHMRLWEYVTSPDHLVHRYNEPVALLKYAYSEGWAGFFACVVLNTNMDSTVNFTNATYNGQQLLPDPYYEVNNASVLLNLYNKVDSFATIDEIMRRNNIDIYEFFDNWFSSSYSAGNEAYFWNIFDTRGCSNDQLAPTVLIGRALDPESYEYNGSESFDNVLITKYEWLVDESVVYTGYGHPGQYTVDVSGLTIGCHTLTLRCYDPEGEKTAHRQRLSNPYGESFTTILI